MTQTISTPQQYQLFIKGEEVSPLSEQTFETYNPATGEVIAKVAQAGPEDVDRAVKAAREAHESGVWRNKPAAERSIILNKIADLIQENLAELAALETQNNGKPINESTFIDLPMSIDTFRYYAAAARMLGGQAIPVPGALTYTLKEPVGVCGQIIPWNFPIMMAAWKMAPALAAGNTIVLKPAEQTPLTALRLAELFKQAGVPDGVVNVITGDGSTGEALVKHPGVDKIAFTGSTEVGRKVMINAAGSLKRVSLELGGKSPNVVFEDANLEQAVNGALFAIYFNQGQICTAGSRLFVQDSIYDSFVEKLVAKLAQLRVGDPTQNTTQIGALVSQEQFDKVKDYIEIGKSEGAKLAFGGQDLQAEKKGFFVQPTVFTDVDNNMRIAQEEIFGPVLSVIRFKDDAEAARLVNEIPYGLVSAIWTENVRRAHNFARMIQAGYVWINTYNILPIEAPFGGYKQSGFGRELGYGALDMYTETKNVYVELNEASPITGWYGV
ncbi:betaine-aldehyde dehydrogenase [bacterium (Candidatus Blackallbacteria) CG17_big_fil_post_rev_8_21_14_2_50_48_46]|uniref:Aldehyde dehydrogenase n=1 Tax=bacterium (Candidatus Blackallbacteria) CG17_big_fil_post_rev_8_21_14_2_50_48_46 TaxID=2014261 RepID=A0A2M7FZW5_9BACT|nr:MAG: betaine-aldehyde dehydrogenase [bacterium (Candidatus Blackallbacteria) CG18_big_fil_WC_8_21_14_2_50_49_26]PIW14889.1 MAG: betaine-aldehyde dehydrogenase [bacterium (Candidatus Blackallbacteria) CG17_big_fil_post_rev_8_21_14_2_50_48_46]PIW44323.1 MAG: betaine-aldehyde dehydrogenase [bacterium (Candidatus Blackallbacteria) CG13_big_fil_rev_8_21_14_2_50_49_14]